MVIYAASKVALREDKVIWREPKPGAQEIWDEYLRLRKIHGNDNEEIEKELVRWYHSLPKVHPSKSLSRYKHVDEYGPWRDRDISWPGGSGPRYDVPHPETHRPCKVPEAGWRFATAEAMQRKIDLGLVEFRDDHTEPPFLKARLKPRYEELDEESPDEALSGEDEVETDDDKEVGLQVMGSYIYKQSQVAVKYLKSLMGAKVFDNPKDHEVLARIISYCSPDDALVLDFFAGAASTAEAVLRLNHTNRASRRRFIMVQLPEPTRRKKANGKYVETLAYKKGFKNIAELSKERIRRVIAKLRADKAEKLDFGEGGTDNVGFKVFKLTGPNIQQWKALEDRDADAYAQELELFNDPLIAGWKPEAVIWEVALREGFGLNTQFKARDLPNGNKVYDVFDPDTGQVFIICLDDQIRSDFSKNIELKSDTLFICRDVALDDSAAANFALQCRLRTI